MPICFSCVQSTNFTCLLSKYMYIHTHHYQQHYYFKQTPSQPTPSSFQRLNRHLQRSLLRLIAPNKPVYMHKNAPLDPARSTQLLVSQSQALLQDLLPHLERSRPRVHRTHSPRPVRVLRHHELRLALLSALFLQLVHVLHVRTALLHHQNRAWIVDFLRMLHRFADDFARRKDLVGLDMNALPELSEHYSHREAESLLLFLFAPFFAPRNAKTRHAAWDRRRHFVVPLAVTAIHTVVRTVDFLNEMIVYLVVNVFQIRGRQRTVQNRFDYLTTEMFVTDWNEKRDNYIKPAELSLVLCWESKVQSNPFWWWSKRFLEFMSNPLLILTLQDRIHHQHQQQYHTFSIILDYEFAWLLHFIIKRGKIPWSRYSGRVRNKDTARASSEWNVPLCVPITFRFSGNVSRKTSPEKPSSFALFMYSGNISGVESHEIIFLPSYNKFRCKRFASIIVLRKEFK